MSSVLGSGFYESWFLIPPVVTPEAGGHLWCHLVLIPAPGQAAACVTYRICVIPDSKLGVQGQTGFV